MNYKCETCEKLFTEKGKYTRHINTTLCKDGNNIVKKYVKKIIEEKVQPIKEKEDKIIVSKPILKWVGGKTQILDKLINKNFPKEINNYHEIFLGGGSVLLALLSYIKQGIIKINGNVYAYDLNESLIYLYKNIQTHHNELYDNIQKLIKDYYECPDIKETGTGTKEVNEIVNDVNKIKKEDKKKRKILITPKNLVEAKVSREYYYYWIRSEYNRLSLMDKKEIDVSAMFVFLNKTCFRGVFRVGPNGFNVPYGHYDYPEIINKEHLDEIHELIQNVIFECCDFTKSLSIIENNDYVYLDPPYNKEVDTSFVGYTENGFGIETHTNLFDLCNELNDKKIKFMMSNSNTELVKQHFPEEKNYNIEIITAKRSINSKNPGSKTTEVIIRNYEEDKDEEDKYLIINP